MAKNNKIDLSNIDVNSHEFTLHALTILFDNDKKLHKMFRKIVKKHNFVVVYCAGMFFYQWYKIEKIKDEIKQLKEKEEKTTE